MPRSPRRADRLAAISAKLREALSELEGLRDDIEHGHDDPRDRMLRPADPEERASLTSALDGAYSAITRACDVLDLAEFR